MPTVSIIVPTRDRPRLVARALESILAQTWTDWEIVLVDNNRAVAPVTENPALAAILADARVVVVRDEASVNAAQSRNVGLARATGEWVTYLDDDDVYRPTKIEKQLALARSSGAALVLCGYCVRLVGRRRVRQVGQTVFRGDDRLLEATWGTPFMFHCADPRVRFDPTLAVGHDEEFAHRLIATRGIDAVPCCAEPLVDVYPQVGSSRVRADLSLIARSYRATARHARRLYSARARRIHLLRGRLVRGQGGGMPWLKFWLIVGAVWRARGGRDWRLVVNSVAYRFKWLRRFIVT